MRTAGRKAKRMRFMWAAIVAVLVCLIASAGAGAGGRDNEPQRPAKDWPSQNGLSRLGLEVRNQDQQGDNGNRGDSRDRSNHGDNRGGGDKGGGDDNGGNNSGNNGGGDNKGGGTPTVQTYPLGSAAPGAVGSSALVLYDTTGPYGWLGQLYATAVGNLASHFGSWKAQAVSTYQAGEVSQYTATIYIGSTYDEPLPTAFLDDVYNATRPVVWIYDNIWQLTNRNASTFQPKYGWMWSQFDLSKVSHVAYKGATLSRDGSNNQAGIMGYRAVDATKVTTLATAVRDSNGTTFPWALRSGTLTYVGENPFVYSSETDRLRVFEDLLFDALNPTAQTRHRALLRLEDIDPKYDPAALRAAADYLYSQHVPFGFGVSPVYTDPLGALNNGTPETVRLGDKAGKPVADAIKYLQSRGGTLIMHGYTHQYRNVPNPYNAVTGDDFEFYRTIENADHTLTFVGPVPEDSAAWAAGRIGASFQEFRRAGITAPALFEFPHYAASAVDYQFVSQTFSTRWERVLYFGGFLSGGTLDYTHVLGQMFPYVVRDAYGTVVLPENLGDYEPTPFHQFPVHVVSDILAAGSAESVVRDGVAGVYYHAFHGVEPLRQIVDGLRAQGWTFSSPTQLAANG